MAGKFADLHDTQGKEVKDIDAMIGSLDKLDNLDPGKMKKIAQSIKILGKSFELLSVGVSKVDTSKINAVTESLQRISSTKVKSTTYVNSINKLSEAIKSFEDVGTATSRLNESITVLQGLNDVRIDKSSIKSFSLIPEALAKLNDIDVDSMKLTQIIDSLKGFGELEKGNLGSLLTQLKKLPELVTEFEKVDLDKFSRGIERLATAMKPLANEMDKVSRGFSALPNKMQRFIREAESTSISTGKVAKSFSLASLKAGIFGYGITSILRGLNSFLMKSNEYVENLNLFTVSMGASAKEAMAFAKQVNEVMGIDMSQWMRNQGIFQSLATGFGIVNDKATIMSKNLTQLGYDLSSFFNISVESAMQKLQSGIAGKYLPRSIVMYFRNLSKRGKAHVVNLVLNICFVAQFSV